MSIPVQCPACQHAFAVAERVRGKKGKCPKCGSVFRAEPRADEDDIAVFPAVPAEASGSAEEIDVFPDVSDDVATFPTVSSATVSSESLPPPRPAPKAPRTAAPLPTGVAVAPTTPAFPSASSSGAHAIVHRHKSSPLPLILGGSIAAVAFTAAAGFVLYGLQNQGQPVASNTNTNNSVATNPQDPVTPGPVVPPPLPALDVATLQPLRSRVFRLEITSPSGNRQAACFPVAANGVAATSYHALAQATAVDAFSAEGVKLRVAGMLAVDPAHDLAIVKLEPIVPIALEHLPLIATDPADGSALAGVDIANSTLPLQVGSVKAIQPVSRLAAATRVALQRQDEQIVDAASIVQHNISLPASSEGAPLLDAQGKVIGLHVHYAAGSGGLAVHARHIAELLPRAGEVRPFPAAGVAVNPNPTVTPPAIDNPAPPVNPLEPPAIPSVPEKMPPATEDPVVDVLGRVEEYRVSCDKLQWKPSDAREYAQFQLLASNVMLAATIADAENVSAENKTLLQASVQKALQTLTVEKWPDDAAWDKTGELAEKALATPGEGVFSLARVMLPASAGNMIENQPAAILELVGTKQLIIVTATENSGKFERDARFLVLGIHDPRITARINTPEGEKLAALVRTKYVLAVQSPD